MIKIIESLKTGNEHVLVNAKMIEIFTSIFKDSIKVYAEKKHVEILKKYNNNIEYKKIKVTGHGKGKVKSVIHFLRSIFYNVSFLILSSKNDKIIYLSTNPIGLIIMKIVNYILKREVYMVCHSELEFLISENDKYLSTIYKKIAKIYRWSFNKVEKDSIKYIVLGESIKRNLIKIVKKTDYKNLLVIDLPYEYNKMEEKIEKTKKIKLGCIGIASTAKGTEKIFEIAEVFKDKIIDNKINLSIIGKLTEDVKKFKNDYVEYLNDNVMLPREEYDNKIKELDYILYFYPKDSYKLIASGAFFDAIALEKPIIAIENDFFRYYFDRFGDIGYLCNNLEDMKKILYDIESKQDEYSVYKNRIKEVKQKLSISCIVEQLKEQINN